MTNEAARAWLGLAVNVVVGIAVLVPAAFLLVVSSSVVWQLLSYDGITTVFSWGFDAVIVTLVSIGLAFITVAVAILLGLPFRVSGMLREWWSRFAWVGWVGIPAGMLVMAASWAVGGVVTGIADDVQFSQYQPNGDVLLIGWFFFAFSVVNAPLPRLRRLRRAVPAV